MTCQPIGDSLCPVKRETKAERISLRIPSALMARVKRLATLDRRSVSQIIEIATELGLPRIEGGLKN